MKGLIIINAYPNGEKFYRQAHRIAEELKKLGVSVDVMKNGDVFGLIDGTGSVNVSFPTKYDFIVYLDKDKYLGELLEKSGFRLFNCASAVEICDDKMKTTLALIGKGVPVVDSIPAPLCYTQNAKPNENFLENVAQVLGFPLVVKNSYGSFGEGVHLVHGMRELIELEEKILHVPHFYQRYVAESAGRDIRVMVIGGKAVACMERIAQGEEFRSNIELGGIGRKIELDDECRQVAESAANALGLEYCGVDLLQGKDGAMVCEINSNAFFEGLESVTGYNVAAAYARHILKTTK